MGTQQARKKASINAYDGMDVVTISRDDYWQANHCVQDSYTEEDYEELSESLESLGLSELQESQYEFEGNRAEMCLSLIEIGFVENKQFSKFLEENEE